MHLSFSQERAVSAERDLPAREPRPPSWSRQSDERSYPGCQGVGRRLTIEEMPDRRLAHQAPHAVAHEEDTLMRQLAHLISQMIGNVYRPRRSPMREATEAADVVKHAD